MRFQAFSVRRIGWALVAASICFSWSAEAKPRNELPPGPGIIRAFDVRNITMHPLPSAQQINGVRIDAVTVFLGANANFGPLALPRQLNDHFIRVLAAAKKPAPERLMPAWRSFLSQLENSTGSIDIDQLIFVVLMQLQNAADEDLLASLAEMKALADAKQAARNSVSNYKGLIARCTRINVCSGKGTLDRGLANAQADLDNLSELGDLQQLRLQLAMQRRESALSVLTQVMKAMSDTAAEIIGNMK